MSDVPADASLAISAPDQVLMFMLDSEAFGVDIRRVREIRSWQTIRPIPESSGEVLGLLNLRGGLVPVINLRERLSLPPGEPESGVIIIISAGSDVSRRDMGLVVDGVSDVAGIPSGSARAMPDIGRAGTTDLVRCIATLGEVTMLVLDVDRVLERYESVH